VEDRDFFDAVEYWAGAMTVGSAGSVDGIVATWRKMTDMQRSQITEYLRGLPYERFLQTRYWYAIRLKVRSDRKDRCEICKEKCLEPQVHHRTYEHRGEEYSRLEDLRLLCDRCHSTVHETAREAAILVESTQVNSLPKRN
jgi:5-methylcytosine-specific restriction endonuclease McrA